MGDDVGICEGSLVGTPVVGLAVEMGREVGWAETGRRVGIAEVVGRRVGFSETGLRVGNAVGFGVGSKVGK